MRLYFVRHGHSLANLLNVFSNRGLQHPLTGTGWQQVGVLVDTFKDVQVDGILASPLLRASQTAHALAQSTGASVEVTHALREYDMGELEGRSDDESWALYGELSDDWLLHGKWDRRAPGGESLNDMCARFLPLMDRFRSEEGDGSYVLVGHGGLYRCMLPFALSNVDVSFTTKHSLGNTEYVMAERVGRSFVCREWAGISVPDGARLSEADPEFGVSV